jgi:hypothetical protein
MIRVGRCKYAGGKRIDPQARGFTTIVVLTKSASKCGKIGPYELRDEKGCIMECAWQFMKTYRAVPEVAIRYAPSSPQIVWRWPAEVRVGDDGTILPAYFRRREAGFRAARGRIPRGARPDSARREAGFRAARGRIPRGASGARPGRPRARA